MKIKLNYTIIIVFVLSSILTTTDSNNAGTTQPGSHVSGNMSKYLQVYGEKYFYYISEQYFCSIITYNKVYELRLTILTIHLNIMYKFNLIRNS